MDKKRIILIISAVFVAGSIVFAIKLMQNNYTPRVVVSEEYVPAWTPQEFATPAEQDTDMIADMEAEEADLQMDIQTEMPSDTMDFTQLQNINPDIYAWLQLPDTEISYPVVQRQGNDSFYLNHNSDGAYSASGAIFSETSYNSNDFSDPVTILYGHHMQNGAMFGTLEQTYSDPAFVADHPMFYIYTPDKRLTYGVFAAVPYSGEHILYYHDFTEKDVFCDFFANILASTGDKVVLQPEYAPESGDRVVILSTCEQNNNVNRYLVMGTLLDNVE